MNTSSTEEKPGDIPDYLNKIKHYRKKKEISQEELADMIHISQRAYSNIESGETELTVPRLLEISKVLETPLYKILDINPQNIFNNNFNDNSTDNKGQYYNNENFIKERELYERLLKGKDDEIKRLNGNK